MPEVQPWHLSRLIDPNFTRVDLVKEGANSQAHIKLLKSRKEGGSPMTLEEILKILKPEHRTVIEKELQDITKAKETAEGEVTTLKAQIAKQKDPAASGEQTEEEILKSIQDPAVRALMQTQIAKTKAAEAEVRKARETQIQAEAIAKAKEVPNIGTEETAVVELYKKLKDTDETLCEEVFGIFKAASAMIKEGGMFTEVGKSTGGSHTGSSENDAWGQIESAASEIAKSRSISIESAIGEVIKQRPELYDQYIKAQRG